MNITELLFLRRSKALIRNGWCSWMKLGLTSDSPDYLLELYVVNVRLGVLHEIEEKHCL